MIWPQLTFVAFPPARVPYSVLHPRNNLLLFEHTMPVHISASFHMLFPLLRMPASLLQLVMTHLSGHPVY